MSPLCGARKIVEVSPTTASDRQGGLDLFGGVTAISALESLVTRLHCHICTTHIAVAYNSEF